ncbi:putative Sphingomyelin phosphodiesterase D [Cocos nucifera]|uniref:Putative Sphingomyelin phosphodiesterase D n=1 Tax=Cocos nucifera TaxID=13894 RepID=A0A8K0I3L1_COCNU|nr:putative Sphingomyelin phosphodiesterase D [Cocos nucifera]
MADPESKFPLVKKRHRSRDSARDEAWLRRKSLRHGRLRGAPVGRSVMDEDLDELRGCIDLGFGFAFDSGNDGTTTVARLARTFPALDLYYAVHKQYHVSVVGSGSGSGSDSSFDGSPPDSPGSIISPGMYVQQAKLLQDNNKC